MILHCSSLSSFDCELERAGTLLSCPLNLLRLDSGVHPKLHMLKLNSCAPCPPKQYLPRVFPISLNSTLISNQAKSQFLPFSKALHPIYQHFLLDIPPKYASVSLLPTTLTASALLHLLTISLEASEVDSKVHFVLCPIQWLPTALKIIYILPLASRAP